ncbi:right-handed parallel beta-helix repeat-containing protein [Echinicola strongylocentroti]|uniref:Right-handed parallel beta-helix repeat-containing protein n=1 Tax=Echinicola strongylocentroti TaxID=1795355 RepID=A0A2Z4IPB0_9BACT|nr:right-handed parallel beta-helix repeat-containing protein [Echinicola strongylocentroti]AWW32735.1 right-handed parallel beta-helix repeat-containing protein [Echinicola strongylocentroti]
MIPLVSKESPWSYSSGATLEGAVKYLLIIFILIGGSIIGPTYARAIQEADFYVSPQGSDDWSGTLSSPNSDASDGPFASLERARDAVRELKKDQKKAIVVQVREGVYRLRETVVFGVEDSGEGTNTISYEAYPDETPVFSSGQQITGWKRVTSDLPGLPEVARGNIWVANISQKFFTLYDADGLLPRARSDGFISLDGGNGRNRLHFPAGTIKDWSNLSDVEIIVRPHHAWITNILPLESVNEETNIATTSLDATYAMNKLHFLPDTKNCWIENVLEELDEPGEWVLNTTSGKLYLWRRNDSPVVAPTLNELIRVEGRIDYDGPSDEPVRNLRFKGLTFKHGKRYQLSPEDKGLQHDWDMLDKDNAILRLRGTENCVVESCHFLHSGSGAIRVDLHGIGNTLSSNHIEHMGGGGILLCGYGPGTKDVNKENTVYNNHIHHVGEVYWHSPGIFLWQSGENRVANNLIHHTDYTALIMSGCMSHFFMKNGRELTRTIRRHELSHLPEEVVREDILPFLHTHDNMVEYNEIHHSMLRLGDGNAIYIRASGEDNVIRRNYIHDMVGETQMQAAVRTDGGQTGTLITENLLYRCTSQGILTKLDNRVENNIVVDIIAPPRGYYLSVREGPLTGASIKRNVFYSTNETGKFIDELPSGREGSSEDRRGRLLARVMDADTDYNIYFCKTNPKKGKALIDKNQQDGVDLHSKAVDPLFVDPENGDFNFKSGSPALEMGIVPIDLSQVGLRE